MGPKIIWDRLCSVVGGWAHCSGAVPGPQLNPEPLQSLGNKDFSCKGRLHQPFHILCMGGLS